MEERINDLKQRIQHKIPSLTKSQKVLANFIVENPYHFASSSIRELENDLQISKATIVRFAKALGYQGFQDLRTVFLAGIRQATSPIARYRSFLSERDIDTDFLMLIGDENIRNINNTLSMTDRKSYNKTIEMIKNAGYVHTMGIGISSYLADMTAYLLNHIGIRADCLTYGGLTFTERIVNMTKEDVMFCFSFQF